jgi:hypothetical protein
LSVRTFDPRTKTVSENPLGFDPSDLGWDGVQRDVDFYRPNGSPAGDLDISLPRFDIEIKLGQKAEKIAGKVTARNVNLPSRAGLPYYLASEIPQKPMTDWQNYGKVPDDISNAAKQSFNGHLQVTPEMRGGLPYFFKDVFSPRGVPYFYPSVSKGRK